MTVEEKFMHRCLQLAERGRGAVAPNPMVGAVLVHHDRIIGEGYHAQYGGPHAEVNCFASVNEADRGLIPDGVLYVSLEPCAHFGKTPPCADLIARHQLKTVVVGCRDPFGEVNGKGIRRMEAAGIKVITGVLEQACIDFNKRFFCFHEKQRPYIILKWAQSANQCIAAENSTRVKISNEVSDRLVHRWRSEEAAILVGTGTALKDNPSLTNRLWTGANPVRVVLDRSLKLPQDASLLSRESRTIIFNEKKEMVEGHLQYVKIDGSRSPIQQILKALFDRGLQSVIVEGGTRLIHSFLEEGCWDEARILTNRTMVLENGYPAPKLSSGVVADRTEILSDEFLCIKNPAVQ